MCARTSALNYWLTLEESRAPIFTDRRHLRHFIWHYVNKSVIARDANCVNEANNDALFWPFLNELLPLSNASNYPYRIHYSRDGNNTHIYIFKTYMLKLDYICQFLHDTMIWKVTLAARGIGVLMVKILNKCTLSILVYIQLNIYIYTFYITSVWLCEFVNFLCRHIPLLLYMYICSITRNCNSLRNKISIYLSIYL